MASGTWISTTSGAWSDSGNWSGGVVADGGSGTTATFSADITGTIIIDTTIGGAWSGAVGDIAVSDPGSPPDSEWVFGSQSTVNVESVGLETAATFEGSVSNLYSVFSTLTTAPYLTLKGSNALSLGLGLTTASATVVLENEQALGASLPNNFPLTLNYYSLGTKGLSRFYFKADFDLSANFVSSTQSPTTNHVKALAIGNFDVKLGTLQSLTPFTFEAASASGGTLSVTDFGTGSSTFALPQVSFSAVNGQTDACTLLSSITEVDSITPRPVYIVNGTWTFNNTNTYTGRTYVRSTAPSGQSPEVQFNIATLNANAAGAVPATVTVLAASTSAYGLLNANVVGAVVGAATLNSFARATANAAGAFMSDVSTGLFSRLTITATGGVTGNVSGSGYVYLQAPSAITGSLSLSSNGIAYAQVAGAFSAPYTKAWAGALSADAAGALNQPITNSAGTVTSTVSGGITGAITADGGIVTSTVVDGISSAVTINAAAQLLARTSTEGKLTLGGKLTINGGTVRIGG
jgi:hypothetical protein